MYEVEGLRFFCFFYCLIEIESFIKCIGKIEISKDNARNIKEREKNKKKFSYDISEKHLYLEKKITIKIYNSFSHPSILNEFFLILINYHTY